MPIIGAPLSQPGRMLPDDAQRVHNAALCREAAKWLTRHPDAEGEGGACVCAGEEAPPSVSLASALPPPPDKNRSELESRTKTPPEARLLAKGWSSTHLPLSRRSRRSPGRAQTTVSIPASPVARWRSCLCCTATAQRCFGEQPPCRPLPAELLVWGDSAGRVMASICADRFYKQDHSVPLASKCC